ncbi:unnamed protein product [Paramecium octaurelia]|uniref:EamA domain-containing protein n=1 Tax=Paramecium octaurelia TaxID=43137 RepID=A0A8S1UCW6_PAROT|nr:unnamed protein product [Paramecium octaurelia]
MANYIIKQVQQFEQEHQTLVPTLYQILSSFFFALNHFSVKLFDGIPVTQIIIWRCCLTFIIIRLLNQILPLQSYPKNKKIMSKLLIRGAIGMFGFLACFSSLKLVAVSEAVVLMKTNPIWTTLILVYVQRKEKINIRTALEILTCIIGVIFITKPPLIFGIENSEYSVLYLVGLCLALVTALETAVAQVIIKSLNNQVHSFVILQYFSLFAMAGAVLFQLYSPFEDMRFLSWKEAAILLFSGFLGCLGSMFMNRAMMLGKVTQMALIGETQIVFNILLDLLILKQMIGMTSWIGIGMIATSLTSNIMQKN